MTVHLYKRLDNKHGRGLSRRDFLARKTWIAVERKRDRERAARLRETFDFYGGKQVVAAVRQLLGLAPIKGQYRTPNERTTR